MKKLTFLMLGAAMAACGSRQQTPAQQPAAETVAAAPDTTVTLTFALAGDVVPATTFPADYLPRNGGRNLFDSCAAILQRADIAAANLEGVLLDGEGKPRPMTNPDTYYLFRIPTSYVGVMADAGFDFLGIANNHINDFGQPGRSSTMASLRRGGMAHAGLRDSCDYAVLERKGLRVAITQFGHGDNNLDVNDTVLVGATVRRMLADADMAIVAFHGGAEGADHTHVPHGPEVYVGEKRGNVEEFAHAAVNAGAALVYGHGPHVPRAWELYRGRLIIYSLGNFCTPFRMNVGGPCGLAPIVEVTLREDGTIVSHRIHSFIQRKGAGPVPDPRRRAEHLIRALSAADFPDSSPF